MCEFFAGPKYTQNGGNCRPTEFNFNLKVIYGKKTNTQKI